MIEDEMTRLELSLESLWHDMQGMTREELESYTERLYIKLYDLKYQQRVKEARERYEARVNAVYQPH